ncbi:hypothetical protein Aglo01_67150 [Actinokineospora globicatena]|nr:hypothetical protein Aglo01_67150 [Actinokineospora globicatena]GLW89027.1 hypothetical protein Aglo02_66660 [Actinokineospora globicatena]
MCAKVCGRGAPGDCRRAGAGCSRVASVSTEAGGSIVVIQRKVITEGRGWAAAGDSWSLERVFGCGGLGGGELGR